MKDGHVAFITGGGKGIGRAISLALAREGIRIAVAGRTQADLEKVALDIQWLGHEAMPVVCDVTQPDSIARAVETVRQAFGGIDILVNNAGAAESAKFVGHDDALWHRMIETNLDSTYYVAKAVVPMMIEGRWGRIINMASLASKVGGKYLAAYTASKHGVLGLTRALAIELVSYNITVNAICPGYVDTPMTDRSAANISARTGMPEEKARDVLKGTSPQNRLITPEEVAAVGVLLVGDAARGITGQAINVDGGAVMF